MMNTDQNSKTAQRMLYILNIFLLLVHTGLLLLFNALHVTLMVRVNIVSVLCYLLCFLVVKGERINEYVIIAFMEIIIHSFLAVLSVGADFGFQLYHIGCIAVLFFADYFSVHIGARRVKGLALSIVSSLLYIISLIVVRFCGSIYQMDDGIAFIGTIFNTMLALIFVIFILSTLTNAAIFYDAELTRQATHDKLTGMVNRHYLVDYLGGIYASGDVENRWLAILDIDDFKGINDKFGHLCGDFVLKSVAEMIKKHCGDRVVCRWGGEEFLIVGVDPGEDGGSGADEAVLLEDIRRSIANKDFVYHDGTVIHLTVTIGAACYQNGQTVDEWVNTADGRLYDGKRTGKNKVVGTDQILTDIGQ